MGEQVVGWNRYGHRRTYVNDDDGTALGYRDEKTGAVTVLVAARADAVRRALAAPAPSTAPRAPDPRRQAAARKGLATQSWHSPTLSEKALADALTSGSPFHWAREVAWDRYRLDFYCAAARLAVEVDGSSHRHKAESDARRDEFFRGQGIETVRIPATDVERDSAAVVANLNRLCIARSGAVPPTVVPARGLVARLLGRTEQVVRPALAPGEYRGRRRGGAFVCARCRREHAAAERSATTASCCAACAG
jgi:very-short-patch-repair endonuclease